MCWKMHADVLPEAKARNLGLSLLDRFTSHFLSRYQNDFSCLEQLYLLCLGESPPCTNRFQKSSFVDLQASSFCWRAATIAPSSGRDSEYLFDDAFLHFNDAKEKVHKGFLWQWGRTLDRCSILVHTLLMFEARLMAPSSNSASILIFSALRHEAESHRFPQPFYFDTNCT